MKKIAVLSFVAALGGILFGHGTVALAETPPCGTNVSDGLTARFDNPPQAARPWCYWWWINGHVDRQTITADLEAMKRLGFGGLLMFDSRGYWDDEDHLANPKAEIDFMSPAWFDLVAFAVRECARLGLTFSMNASASGGWCNGFRDGKEYVVDILDGQAVSNHLDRLVGPLVRAMPELVGRTFTHLYSVSFEGNVKGGDWRDVKDRFYRTMADWAHGHGLKVFSEAGGPWVGGCTKAFAGARQLEMFDFNDFPQGEFWPQLPKGDVWAGHANANFRGFVRGVVLAARRKDSDIVSCEAFTHMQKHWSVDPAFLKPLADQAFADGVNRLVWHTFTCSPDKFGVPGAEYFAGTHVNRHVTWQREAAGFVGYLARCQALLQAGEYVDDGQFDETPRDYYGWGRFRKDPDAQFTWTHRRDGTNDWFFVAGENAGEVAFPAVAPRVELWDAVTGTRTAADATVTADGTTRVRLNLPWGGSTFVMFLRDGAREAPARREPKVVRTQPVKGPWNVSFAYHPGIAAQPPKPIVLEDLVEWTSDDRLKFFSGTAVYRTSFVLPEGERTLARRISLGPLPSGLAHVYLNGVDCGCVWCAPWTADVSAAVRAGANELEVRYVNNWRNRLIGDCFLDPADRVTRSTIRYRRGPAGCWKDGVFRRWRDCSGYSSQDPLQPSGLLGPVEVLCLEE